MRSKQSTKPQIRRCGVAGSQEQRDIVIADPQGRVYLVQGGFLIQGRYVSPGDVDGKVRTVPIRLKGKV